METLKSRQDIQKLFKTGKRLIQFPLTIVYNLNNKDGNRYLYCTDRSAKTAVQRNRIKRVLRAVVFEIHNFIPIGFDVALIGNYKITQIDFNSRKSLCSSLFSRLQC